MVKDPHGLFAPSRSSKLLLMRHPQTVQNIEARYQGQTDSALSTLGEEQRDRAIAGLISWRPDHLFSSPLSRCLEIARPVAEALQLDLRVDQRLLEMCFGQMEGLTHDQAVKKGFGFPWEPGSGIWPIPGAESIELFTKRLISVANEISSLGGRVAAVTHGGVIRGICSYWMHIPSEHLWEMAVRNVESACFSVDDEGTIFLEAFGIWPEWLAGI